MEPAASRPMTAWTASLNSNAMNLAEISMGLVQHATAMTAGAIPSVPAVMKMAPAPLMLQRSIGLNSGGFFMGLDSTCDLCDVYDPIGACCVDLGDGNECYQLSEFDCTLFNGMFISVGISCDEVPECAPLGACCVPVGDTPSCYDAVTQDLCEGGSWFEGQTCEDINWECNTPWGACCLLDINACLDGFSEIECNQENGVFYVETTCSDVTCEGTIGACLCWPRLLRHDCMAMWRT